MSKVINFLFTNKTATVSKSLSLYDMAEMSNYGVKDTDGKSRLINTTGTDFGTQSEYVTYSAKSVPSVKVNIPVQNPQKKTKGVQYGVQVEDILRTTDTDDDSEIIDNPIRVQIIIAHENSSAITEARIGEVLGRAVSSLQHANGDWRFNELASLATRPSTN
jgi:hypothetical protein